MSLNLEDAQVFLARSILLAIALFGYFFRKALKNSNNAVILCRNQTTSHTSEATHVSPIESFHDLVEFPKSLRTEVWDREYVADAGVPLDDQCGVLAMSRSLGNIAKGVTEPLCDPLTLLRFYNSREKVVEDAVAMYRETIAWRESFGIARIMQDFGDSPAYDDRPGKGNSRLIVTASSPDGTNGSVAVRDTSNEYKSDGSNDGAADTSIGATSWSYRRNPKTPQAKLAQRLFFAGVLDEPDNSENGAPILVWRVGVFDLPGVAREDGMIEVMTEAFVSHLEEVFQAGRAASLKHKRLIRGRLVIDGTGLGLSTIRYNYIVKKIAAMGLAFIPETTASATIVRAPWVFAKIYGFVRPLLTPLQQRKVNVLTGNDLSALGGPGAPNPFTQHSTLRIDQLPEFLGGQTSDRQCPFPEPVPRNAMGSME